MNYKIERRKINEEDLMLAYQFDDISTEKPFGADTWISVQNWSSIYAYIETLVDRDSKTDQNHEQSFELNETPFTCYISWSSMTSSLGQSISAFLAHFKSNPPYDRPTFIHIRVSKSISSKFTNHIKSLEKEIVELKRQLKRSAHSSSSKTSSSSTTRSSSRIQRPSKSSTKPTPTYAKDRSTNKSPIATHNSEILAEVHEEYVPNAVPTAATPEPGIKYKPGKVPDTVDSKHVEQYVPPEVSPTSLSTPRYIPSSSTSNKLPTTNGHHKSKPNLPGRSNLPDTRRNKRNATDLKRDHSPDLFENDEDSQSQNSVTERVSSRPQRNIAEKTYNPTKTEATAAKATATTPVANKRPKSSRNATTSKTATTATDIPAKTSPKSKMLSAEDFKTYMDTKDKAIAEMNNLQKLLQPEKLPDIEIVSLRHLSSGEIERQFEVHKPMLTKLFQNFCRKKEYKVVPPLDLSEYCCNYLLEESQQMKMMDVLTNAFGDAETLTVYYDLFWKLMMPEWALSMFMEMYEFNRTDATKRMRIQEKIRAAQYELEDTMGFDDDSFANVKKTR